MTGSYPITKALTRGEIFTAKLSKRDSEISSAVSSPHQVPQLHGSHPESTPIPDGPVNLLHIGRAFVHKPHGLVVPDIEDTVHDESGESLHTMGVFPKRFARVSMISTVSSLVCIPWGFQ